MTDSVSEAVRSFIMSRIKARNTSPELITRRFLHGQGYRYTLHSAKLPGKPDLVFNRRRKVVFVHGCFWHSHEGCKRATRPSAHREYWDLKLNRNIVRDRETISKLEGAGWQVFIVWECALKDKSVFADLLAFLGPPSKVTSTSDSQT